jgi:hypothetical protein
MRERKTVPVADVVRVANVFLATRWATTKAERLAIASYAEAILSMANAYRGYRYLETEYLPADQQTNDNVLCDGFDDSRRHYFTAG